MTQTTLTLRRIPAADTLVSSPLRNRVELELAAPPQVVWGLVGDLARYPEYSMGSSAWTS